MLFDQRGALRSTPLAETRDNTTQHLIDDLERLREHLGIERWLLTAGSWGTTLGIGCVLAASMTFFSVLQTRLVLHEVLIAIFVTLTTPVNLLLLVRAALYRDRREGRGQVPQPTPPAGNHGDGQGGFLEAPAVAEPGETRR